MMPLERSLAELVRAGIVSLDAARALASDPKAFDGHLGPATGRRRPSATGPG